MSATAEPDANALLELGRRRYWNMGMFRRLGYSESEARELAEEGVDPHYVEALLKKNATLEEAARIAR